MNTNIQFLDDDALKAISPQSESFCKDFIVVDVRAPDEAKREHIPGSLNIPLNELSEEKLAPYKDKKIIFHCQIGGRTQQARETLASMPGAEKFCLQGGISQWKRCQFETTVNKAAPIELMRQVQLVSGGLIILGLILAYLISPYFLLLDLFVGLGMMFAGITGFCGMAKLLALLPYNKV